MQKNKGNNDDTANAKALASTSETSVGNVPFNSSISKYSDNVKKFSLDVDSDGNKLTQQQAEYFKNSKVRDDDGNLLKVYHGTSESFTAFS